MPIEQYNTNTVDIDLVGIGAEVLLNSLDSPGVYVLRLDLANMQAGDTVRVYSEVDGVSAGFQMEAIEGEFSDAPDDAAFACVDLGPVVIATDQGGSFSIEQTAGTERTFDWIITRIYDA